MGLALSLGTLGVAIGYTGDTHMTHWFSFGSAGVGVLASGLFFAVLIIGSVRALQPLATGLREEWRRWRETWMRESV